MTNINPNNDVGKVNHIVKKESKVNKKKEWILFSFAEIW